MASGMKPCTPWTCHSAFIQHICYTFIWVQTGGSCHSDQMKFFKGTAFHSDTFRAPCLCGLTSAQDLRGKFARHCIVSARKRHLLSHSNQIDAEKCVFIFALLAVCMVIKCSKSPPVEPDECDSRKHAGLQQQQQPLVVSAFLPRQTGWLQFSPGESALVTPKI